jgi:hypothetical protein
MSYEEISINDEEKEESDDEENNLNIEGKKKKILLELKTPLNKPFYYWCKLLNDPKKQKWIWKNKEHGVYDEFCVLIFFACFIHMEEKWKGKLFPDTNYMKYIKKNKSLFKMLCIQISLEDPLNLLRELKLKWHYIEGISKIEHLRVFNEDDGEEKRLIQEKWNKYKYERIVFGGTRFQKMWCYIYSKTFYDVFILLITTFHHVGKTLISNNNNTTLNKMRSMLTTRYFNFFFNNTFQIATPLIESGINLSIWKNSTKDEISEDIKDKKKWVKKFDRIFREIRKDNLTKFTIQSKKFFICYSYDDCVLEQEKWKTKDKIIDSCIWKLMNISNHLMIDDILKKKNFRFNDEFKYINIEGFCKKNFENIKKKVNSHGEKIFTYMESLTLLNFLNVWFIKKANLKNFVKSFVIFYSASYDFSSFYKNYLTDYPRIIDLSRNEWAVIFENKIFKGDILQTIIFWARLILENKGGYLSTNSAENNFVDLRYFFSDDFLKEKEQELEKQSFKQVNLEDLEEFTKQKVDDTCKVPQQIKKNEHKDLDDLFK